MPCPSCCDASPARPRRGSSSPRPWVAGFSCGMPVAEAIVRDGASRLIVNEKVKMNVNVNLEEQEVDLDYKYLGKV